MSYHQSSGNGEDGLQVAAHQGIEVEQSGLELPPNPYKQQYDSRLLNSSSGYDSRLIPSSPGYDAPIEGRKIDTVLGLSRRAFWIVLGCICFLVIAIAIGGGVGGALAVKNSSNSKAGAAQMSSSSTVSSSSSTMSLTGTITASTGTTSSSSTSTGTSTSSSATPTPSATTDCPLSNGTTYTPNDGNHPLYTFTKYCSTAFSGYQNIAEATVMTFDYCIEMCANYNTWHNNATCVGVAYTLSGPASGNCWALEGNMTMGASAQGTYYGVLTSYG